MGLHSSYVTAVQAIVVAAANAGDLTGITSGDVRVAESFIQKDGTPFRGITIVPPRQAMAAGTNNREDIACVIQVVVNRGLQTSLSEGVGVQGDIMIELQRRLNQKRLGVTATGCNEIICSAQPGTTNESVGGREYKSSAILVYCWQRVSRK